MPHSTKAYLLVSLVMVFSGCGRQASEETDALDDSTSQVADFTTLKVLSPGEFGNHVFMIDGDNPVSFGVSVPPGNDPNTPAPLVVSLHPGGSDQQGYGAGSLALLVYPALSELNGVFIAPDSFGESWNHKDVEERVIRLIEEVMKQYNIDKDRILLTGYSMGGHGTWELASRHQDLFTAAIPISARPNEAMLDVDWKIPLYVIHSKSDEIIPIADTREVVEKLRSKGKSVTFVELEDLRHYETGKFVEPLKETLGWLGDVWSADK